MLTAMKIQGHASIGSVKARNTWPVRVAFRAGHSVGPSHVHHYHQLRSCTAAGRKEHISVSD
jgi:hypothetical protein